MFVDIQQITRSGRSRLSLSLSLVNGSLGTSSDRFSYLGGHSLSLHAPSAPLHRLKSQFPSWQKCHHLTQLPYLLSPGLTWFSGGNYLALGYPIGFVGGEVLGLGNGGEAGLILRDAL